MNCPTCGKKTSSISENKCPACHIGDRDPIDWMIEKVFDKDVKYSTYESVRLDRRGQYIAVGLTYRKDSGYSLNCWDLKGHAYPDIYLGVVSKEEIRKEIDILVLRLWLYSDEDMVPCSSCDTVISRRNVAGRHFAGGYCADCWLKYTSNSKRICGMCHTPMYNCCC